MPRRLLAIARRARNHEPFWIDALSGAASVVWGAYSNASRARLEDNPIYRHLTTYVPGAFWEALSIVLGVIQLAALSEDNRIARSYAGALLCMWWSIPARAILDSDTGAPAVAVYGVFGVVGNFIIVWCYAPDMQAHLGRCCTRTRNAVRTRLRRLRGAR